MTQNYEEMIDNILQEGMSETAFRFWKAMKEKIPPIWNRNSSATLKYHKKDDGHVATIAKASSLNDEVLRTVHLRDHDSHFGFDGDHLRFPGYREDG